MLVQESGDLYANDLEQTSHGEVEVATSNRGLESGLIAPLTMSVPLYLSLLQSSVK